MNTNYTNFSSEKLEPVTAEFQDVVDDPKPETVEENVVEETDKMGKVICSKLYLRSEPSTDSKEVAILNKDDELMIVTEDEEWCGVYTASGLEGFCKKEFVEVI